MKTFSKEDLSKFANSADDPKSGAISTFLTEGINIGEAGALKDVMNELRKLDDFKEEKAQNLRQKVLRVINRLPGFDTKKYGAQVFVQREEPSEEPPKAAETKSSSTSKKTGGPRRVTTGATA